MKMNKYILFPAALGILSAACVESHETLPAIPATEAAGGHAITIGAGYKWGGADDATRVMLDTGSGEMYWTPGDNVGLTITPTGSLTPIVHNVQMTGNQTSNVLQTTFTGTLTEAQYAQLDPDGLYNYYTYFPYNAAAGTFPDVRFTLPATVSVRPNVLNPFLAPMVAKAQTGKPPQVFFSGSDVTYDQLDFNFRYDHIMSYAAIELDTALLPEPVTSIVITNQNNRGLAGTLIFNMAYPGTVPSWGWTSGSTSVTLEIEGGLTPGPGQVLYLPVVPADMSSETLTFEFRTASATNNYITKSITGTNFRRGIIHTLSIALPARYTTNTAFTVTESGYYSIEAWGGDGGRGGRGEQGTVSSQSTGGIAQKAAGCYYLTAGTDLSIYIGKVGGSLPGDSEGNGAGGTGGKNGYGSGNGGQGGYGYTYEFDRSGAGGGGGAGTFILSGSTVLHVSGGGAGGGGGAGNSLSDFSNGGNGGAGNGGNGSPGTNGGSGGGGAGGSAIMDGFDGGNGGDGNTGFLNAPGGGGGGGGGGYRGGNGGTGGQAGFSYNARGGGGGKGGGNLSSVNNPNNYPLPNNPRANNPDGYVVITLLR